MRLRTLLWPIVEVICWVVFYGALSKACFSQTTSPTGAAVASPSYFSTTGVRYSYYDQTLTETTNLGVHVTGAQGADVPKGLWAVASIDATPRSKASSAALRVGARYFLSAIANGKAIVYANVAAGATTSSTATSQSLLGNLQGGLGFVWRACRTFNPASKVNCIVDLDYELNSVSTQAVKPVIGLFVGLAF